MRIEIGVFTRINHPSELGIKCNTFVLLLRVYGKHLWKLASARQQHQLGRDHVNKNDRVNDSPKRDLFL